MTAAPVVGATQVIVAEPTPAVAETSVDTPGMLVVMRADELATAETDVLDPVADSETVR